MSDGWSEVLADHRIEELTLRSGPHRRPGKRPRRRTGPTHRPRSSGPPRSRISATGDLSTYQQLGIGGRSVEDLATDATRAADEDDLYNDALKTIERIEKQSGGTPGGDAVAG